MDDPEVDLADRVGFVVEQGDDLLGGRGGEGEFFVKFAGHGGMIGVRACAAAAGIDRIDVPADADGDLGMEPAFAAGLAAGVVEDLIAAAEDARLRFALAGLFLVHPELANRATALDASLPTSAQAELRKQYVAAMYLQRLWRTHLRMQFGETLLLPEQFTAALDLPPPDMMHGEYGLRLLCDRSAYNDWSSYQQVIDLLSAQPCAPDRVMVLVRET